tara:strand:+ start:964 stop:1329 length:366 start_codon:yes stop_codon:yes gene_type:complete
MSDKNLDHHVAVYRNVFIGLLVCTFFTVWIAYQDVDLVDGSIAGAVFLGLLVACYKGYLVAANFMHLKDEVPWITSTLLLTVFFFIVLLLFPLLWEKNNMNTNSYYDKSNMNLEINEDEGW